MTLRTLCGGHSLAATWPRGPLPAGSIISTPSLRAAILTLNKLAESPLLLASLYFCISFSLLIIMLFLFSLPIFFLSCLFLPLSCSSSGTFSLFLSIYICSFCLSVWFIFLYLFFFLFLCSSSLFYVSLSSFLNFSFTLSFSISFLINFYLYFIISVAL